MWAFQRWWAAREPARPFCNSPGKWGPWQGRLRLRTLASDKKATPMTISQRLSNCQSETSRTTPKPLNWSHQFIFVVLSCWFLKQTKKPAVLVGRLPIVVALVSWGFNETGRPDCHVMFSPFLVVFQPNPNAISIKSTMSRQNFPTVLLPIRCQSGAIGVNVAKPISEKHGLLAKPSTVMVGPVACWWHGVNPTPLPVIQSSSIVVGYIPIIDHDFNQQE